MIKSKPITSFLHGISHKLLSLVLLTGIIRGVGSEVIHVEHPSWQWLTTHNKNHVLYFTINCKKIKSYTKVHTFHLLFVQHEQKQKKEWVVSFIFHHRYLALNLMILLHVRRSTSLMKYPWWILAFGQKGGRYREKIVFF